MIVSLLKDADIEHNKQVIQNIFNYINKSPCTSFNIYITTTQELMGKSYIPARILSFNENNINYIRSSYKIGYIYNKKTKNLYTSNDIVYDESMGKNLIYHYGYDSKDFVIWITEIKQESLF